MERGNETTEDKKQLIFEKYYRVKEYNTENISGLGLGLYIIQNIMLEHNSKIEIKSKESNGSVFSFALPLAEKNIA